MRSFWSRVPRLSTLPDSADRDGDSATGASPDVAWGTVRGPIADRVALAAGLAARLNAELADRLPVGDRTGAPRVLVTRAAEQAGPLVAALRETGLVVHAIPTIAFEPVEAGGSLDETAANLDRYDWVVVTSANGARAIGDAIARAGSDRTTTRWAAVGTATATALVERGITPDFVPASADGDAMAGELPVVPGERALLARGDLADGRLPDRLRARGATVDEVVAYRTREAPADSRQRLSEVISAGPLDAIVFTSGSTVRGLLALLTPQERRVALRSPAWCIGPSTAAVARESGFGRVNESPVASAPALAVAIVDALLPATSKRRSPPQRRRRRR